MRQAWLVMGQQQLVAAVESQPLVAAVERLQPSAVAQLSAEELEKRLDTMYNQVNSQLNLLNKFLW